MSSNSWDRLSDRRVVRVPFSCRDRSFLKKKKRPVSTYIYIYIYIFSIKTYLYMKRDLFQHEKRPISIWKRPLHEKNLVLKWLETCCRMRQVCCACLRTGLISCIHFKCPLQERPISTWKETGSYMKWDQFINEKRPASGSDRCVMRVYLKTRCIAYHKCTCPYALFLFIHICSYVYIQIWMYIHTYI